MASKESLPNNSENLGKAKWDTFSTKMLLDICMVEIRKCGKPGIAFRNKKWEEIRDEYNKRANKNYTQKQLKNRMDTLRGEWTIWKQLLGKETGLGWNHQIGNIDADSAWWDAKIRENVKYAKFRFQGLIKQSLSLFVSLKGSLTSHPSTSLSEKVNSIQISTLPVDLKSLALYHPITIPANGLLALSKKMENLTSLTCYKFASKIDKNDLFFIADCFPLLEELILTDTGYVPFILYHKEDDQLLALPNSARLLYFLISWVVNLLMVSARTITLYKRSKSLRSKNCHLKKIYIHQYCECGFQFHEDDTPQSYSRSFMIK